MLAHHHRSKSVQEALKRPALPGVLLTDDQTQDEGSRRVYSYLDACAVSCAVRRRAHTLLLLFVFVCVH